ncbi:MAG: LacI family DNA-binding transcriptional regulator [Ruthenibacterium sp.]
MGKYTIRDIAKKAGVSHTTVSLVLNSKNNRVSQATKDKVIAIAKEMNYSPNQIAVSLATKKTFTLGIILPNLINTHFSAIASGVQSYAQSQGYSVFLCNTNESVEKCIAYVNEFVNRNMDGFVLIPPALINENGDNEKLYATLEECEIPYVLVEHAVLHLFHDFVTIDNRSGGYIATEHLLELNHKKIGCITGPRTEIGAKRRFRGYKEALADYSIEFQKDFVYNGDYSFNSGIEGGKNLIEKGVTAIFCCNDLMALGVNKAAAGLGMKIPEQLSIVGFDQNPICEYLNIPLTTISQPSIAMGKKACEILLDGIEDSEEFQRDYYFSPTLIVRNSTAVCPNIKDAD